MATRTIAYLRVSTDKQADRGISLDAQRAKALAYAELYDLELVEVTVDAGESAKTLDRPGLQRALGMLRDGTAQALLVAKLDRLTRSVAHLGELLEIYFSDGKSALLSVGEQIDTRSAAGRLVLNILASVSQWEREAIGERTAAAMQHKAARGEYTGGEPPFGYRREAEMLVAHPEEQAAIELARQLYAGHRSLRGVARELESRGIRAGRGGCSRRCKSGGWWRSELATPARDPRLPPPGTVIEKCARHGAVRSTCTVEEGGIRYHYKPHRSLSGRGDGGHQRTSA